MSDYTDPALRDAVKAEVLAGDKGGRPGQWSARKAQLVARLYTERGGGYVGEKDASARHLDRWTEEEWQTEDGAADARDGDVTHRYLPKQAWEQLTDAEKEATDRAKTAGDGQFVANTPAAKAAGQAVREPLPGYDSMTVHDVQAALRDGDEGLLDRVLRYERAHKARKGVLSRAPR